MESLIRLNKLCKGAKAPKVERTVKPLSLLSILGFIVLTLQLSGCASLPSEQYPIHTTQNYAHLKTDFSKSKLVKQKLLNEYVKWKGTPYRYGGESLKGIDCSALVQTTFRQQFGILLPRTAAEQAETGRYVSLKNLKTGDIVFFDIGFGITSSGHHNGIYLGNGEFMHASSHHGVTVSNIKTDYWRHHYWTARRIRVTASNTTH